MFELSGIVLFIQVTVTNVQVFNLWEVEDTELFVLEQYCFF